MHSLRPWVTNGDDQEGREGGREDEDGADEEVVERVADDENPKDKYEVVQSRRQTKEYGTSGDIKDHVLTLVGGGCDKYHIDLHIYTKNVQSIQTESRWEELVAEIDDAYFT